MTTEPESKFEESYFGDYAGRGTYRDDRLKRAFRTRLVGRFLPRGRVLEIGCAYGYLLRALEDRFECAGIDVSEHAISVARTVTKAPVECGDVMELLPRKPDGAFDAVLAFDILEHLPEGQIPGVLSQIARILLPGGAAAGLGPQHAVPLEEAKEGAVDGTARSYACFASLA